MRFSSISALAGVLSLGLPAAAQCPQGMFLASDGEDLLNYGSSIAIDGQRALIGAAGHVLIDGRGYILRRVGGQWVEEDILMPSDDAMNSSAGLSVALQGDVAAVGAPFNDTNRVGNSGAVYLFARTGNQWNEVAKLVEPTVEPNNHFGRALEFDGDTLLIGAPEAGPGNPGRVYVYQRGSDWSSGSFMGVLQAQDAQSQDRFGCALDLDGDQLVVGAEWEDGAQSNTGAVYVFTKPAGGWASALSEAKLTASMPDAFDQLGHSVTLRDGRILAGAPGSGANSPGAVYSFDKVGAAWNDATETGSMRPSIVGGMRMGQAVALLGDTAYCGGSTSLTGNVRRFSWDGSDWGNELPISPPEAGSSEFYGRALALDGSELWIGAINYRDNGPRVGAVFRATPRGGTNSCVGAPNSDDMGGAHLSACGSTSLAANDLMLVVSGGVRGLPGLFFYGANPVQVPFGEGFLCIGAPVFRLFPPVTQDGAGGFHYNLDVTAPPASQGPGAITAGSTWFFQFWYRDPQGGPSAFNLSDAVSLTFQP